MILSRSGLVIGGAVLLAFVLSPIGCSSADGFVDDAPDAARPAQAKEGGPGPAAEDTCPYSGEPVDVSPFAKCKDGGRCIPTGAIPEKERSRLSPCPSGFCVPEKIIVAGGVYLPTACHGLAGGEGRCISTVFPDVEQEKDSLPRDVCDANERCSPCYNPVDGTDTGACRSVPCDRPKEARTVFGGCCKSNGVDRGRCIPESAMPPDGKKGLEKKECESGALCVPNELVTNAPTSPCEAKPLTGVITGKYTGVCLSDCIPRDFLGQIGTAQGNCASGFFCAPCKDPLTAKATGAPGCPP